MQNQNAAQLYFSKSAPSQSARSFWWWPALALQAISGFFVAKIPVQPELAHVSAAFVLLFAAPCYLAVLRWLGRREGAKVLVALAVFALALESFAIVTGWPYGHFVYGEKIGTRLFNLVPWTVPFAWTPLVCASVMLARNLQKNQVAKPLPFLLGCGVILVLIDMVLDPGAVAQGFWRYQAQGAFYNVPAQNFMGWLLTGALGGAIFWVLAPRLRSEVPPSDFLGSCLLILSFWSSVCLWMNLWLPGLIGVALLGWMARLFWKGNDERD
jgi:bisanhydrobacterioruberin hydratase